MNKQTDKTSELMQKMTTKIIKAMEDGVAPWQKPWKSRAAETTKNFSTGKEYKGFNRLYLSMLSTLHGSTLWIGYGQAKKLGGNVKKGEKGTQILAPMIFKDKKNPEKTFVGGFKPTTVFNIMQCEGIDIPVPEEVEERRIEAKFLDVFVKNTKAKIVYNDQACYIPSKDIIGMPDKNQFLSENGYYGTVLHELIHWTGSKNRLDRLADKSKSGYAFEELVAELGSYFASEKIGCPNEAENHTSYLKSWLKSLKDDPKYLIEAATKAEKAANYLIDLQD
jgi:antirestriction protein ArdC